MKFALAGVGFVAERHLRAIKETGNELVAACDIRDSVGILDKYFPKAKFYMNPMEFENAIGDVDYLSICTPNSSHKEYIWMAEKLGIESICEKPLVRPDELHLIGDVNVIQQLRLHPDIHKIKGDKIYITYLTPRGDWYFKSWKGREPLIVNIGIHLFDLMVYLFGSPSDMVIEYSDEKTVGGRFKAGKKEIIYHLSIEGNELIKDINGVDLSNMDLHTKSYQEILKGRGFTKQSIEETLKFVYETPIYANK